MKENELKPSFLATIDALEHITCEFLDHKKHQQHKITELCPVELECREHAERLRKYIKNRRQAHNWSK